MKLSNLFPRKYMKATDLPTDGVTYTIESLSVESMGYDENATEKPVLHFQEDDKALVLNATNAEIIAALYGDETDQWAGKFVTLMRDTTKFKGQVVATIKVRPIVPTAAQVVNKPGDVWPAMPAYVTDELYKLSQELDKAIVGQPGKQPVTMAHPLAKLYVHLRDEVIKAGLTDTIAGNVANTKTPAVALYQMCINFMDALENHINPPQNF